MTVVGVIGLGFMGRTHLEAYSRIPGVTVGAVAATTVPDDAAAQVAATGARYYEDAADLIADPTVEAVSVAVPTYLHREITVAAIRAGKHVLVEKPLGLTTEDCAEIEAWAARSTKVVAVGHVLRHWPGYISVVELVRSGSLGQPITAFAERLSSPPRWSSWLADPKLSGGAVLDFHIHDLDLLNWIFGEPEVVLASGSRGDGGGWDQVVSSVRYAGDDGPVWAVASASTILPDGYPFSTRLQVTCEKGAVEFGQTFDGEQVDSGASGERIRVYEGDGRVTTLEVSMHDDPYFLEVRAFVEAIRSGSPMKRFVQEGALAVRTALAVRRALETQSVVPV